MCDKPAPNRFWRRVRASSHGSQRDAELPVVDTWQPISAFANVQYSSGVCLTTNMATRVPGTLGKARATLRAADPLEPRVTAASWFYARGNTDPTQSKTFVTIEERADRPGVVSQDPAVFGDVIHINLSSHAIGDPQFAPPDGAALAFDCAGTFDAAGCKITVTQNDWTPLAKNYVATVPPSEMTADWKTIILSLERFKAEANQAPPPSLSVLDKINLQGISTKASPFRIANLRWVIPEPPAK